MRHTILFFLTLLIPLAARAGMGYLTLKGEYNANAESEVSTSTFSGGADDGVGWGGGVAFGNHISPYLRAEVEGGYHKLSFDSVDGGGTIPDELEMYSGFGNLYLDLRNSSAIIPYLGAGVGVVFDKETEEHSLGLQGMAGLDIRVGGGMTFFAGYKYLQTQDFERVDDDFFLGPIKQNYNLKAHIAEGGVRFLF